MDLLKVKGSNPLWVMFLPASAGFFLPAGEAGLFFFFCVPDLVACMAWILTSFVCVRAVSFVRRGMLSYPAAARAGANNVNIIPEICFFIIKMKETDNGVGIALYLESIRQRRSRSHF